MKYVITGLESQGKSLVLADIATTLMARNEKWEKKYGFHRPVVSNLRFAPHVEAAYGPYIEYWDQYRTLINRFGIDVIWDEISTDFSAMKREPLPPEVNGWLRQGDKQGVDIYATAQEFHDIHLDFRRRVFQADYVSKVCGSRRGGANTPEPKLIWGVCWKRELCIRPYNELEPQFSDTIGSPFLITKRRCQLFNTHQKILRGEELPYRHVERACEFPDCEFSKYSKDKNGHVRRVDHL